VSRNSGALTYQGRGEMQSGFGWRNPKENYHLENLCADERIMYKRVCKTVDGKLRNGLICPRAGRTFAWYFLYL